MENATKALLIAAAVLIVILLIAFGMRIFNSTKDVSGQATDTGNQIKTSTTSAGDSVYEQNVATIIGKNNIKKDGNVQINMSNGKAKSLLSIAKTKSKIAFIQGISGEDDNKIYTFTITFVNGYITSIIREKPVV